MILLIIFICLLMPLENIIFLKIKLRLIWKYFHLKFLLAIILIFMTVKLNIISYKLNFVF